ncbi:hypothetical protein O6H91_01G093600 [Diphasiastrum complanatum]|uniref:Uncharacterized protein n=1 Tax=Diphasiastrum complanatum TaxID=34168 RepID=A0ACC2ETG6_DIPCM|nr:hypothetical protein O6H91_01G093600 [Diphasiastrum complanatum]
MIILMLTIYRFSTFWVQVVVEVEVISALTRGATAREAKRLCATWIVIDRHLKEEGKCCLEELDSNIVIVTPSTPTILRLNLKPKSTNPHLKAIDSSIVLPDVNVTNSTSNQAIASMSSEAWTPLTATTLSNNSMSSSEPNSPSRSSDFSNYALSETSSVWKMVLDMNSGFDTKTKAQKDNQFLDETPIHSLSNSGTTPDISPLSSPELFSRNFSEQPEEPSLEKRLLTKVRRPMERTSQNSLDEQIKHSSSFMVGSNSWVSPPVSPLLTASSSLPSNLSFRHHENSPSFRKGILKEGALQTPRLLTMKHTGIPLSQNSSPAKFSTKLFPDFVANDALQEADSDVKRAFRKALTFPNPSCEGNDKIKQSSEKARSKLRLDYSTQVNPQQPLTTVHDRLLTRRTTADSPPLCSICQHKSPTFGQPPKNFSFNELELATNYFSSDNFLAEGGYGSVHRGVLPNGQTVAVKQHKLASSQGAKEFCSEVEILSCAQHRNLVMLIGFCIEDSRQLLVYEYVCNGSLDAHLYGRGKPPLKWPARQKIAIGAARGLRYLHEECRVGCIVHRDMRPNNILLTHDFQPMVGDFGLARWQPDGDLGVETRVIGAFGYLAPEYIQSGQITEKADVYSFGIVLLELISGRKAIDIAQPKGQHCLTEWARPLLAKQSYHDLIDPQLKNEVSSTDISCMLQAASLCICQDPHSRPKMSKVLRVLEGDMTIPSPTCSPVEPSYMTSQFKERRRFNRRFVSTEGNKSMGDHQTFSTNGNGPFVPIHRHGRFSTDGREVLMISDQ